MNLTLTPAAARFMRMMILADGKPGSAFRLSVSPGGCSGLAAEIGVADAPARAERMVVVADVPLLLDAESRLLLDGVTVDFVDSIHAQGLVFHDPKQAACPTQGGA
jgi:iron-sulfur cluster assembly accessory protein